MPVEISHKDGKTSVNFNPLVRLNNYSDDVIQKLREYVSALPKTYDSIMRDPKHYVLSIEEILHDQRVLKSAKLLNRELPEFFDIVISLSRPVRYYMPRNFYTAILRDNREELMHEMTDERFSYQTNDRLRKEWRKIVFLHNSTGELCPVYGTNTNTPNEIACFAYLHSPELFYPGLEPLEMPMIDKVLIKGNVVLYQGEKHGDEEITEEQLGERLAKKGIYFGTDYQKIKIIQIPIEHNESLFHDHAFLTAYIMVPNPTIDRLREQVEKFESAREDIMAYARHYYNEQFFAMVRAVNKDDF